jgi:hypothetical protein
VLEDDGKAGAARVCDCQKRQRVPRLLAAAGVPARYANCRLGNFKVRCAAPSGWCGPAQPAQRCRELLGQQAGRFRETGLLFIGPPGVGKPISRWPSLERSGAARCGRVSSTHLADLQIRPPSIPNRRVSTITRSGHQRQTPGARRLGAQALVQVTDILYLVLNSRYTRRLPTLFTATAGSSGRRARFADRAADSGRILLRERIPAPLLSRLYEMAQPIVESVDFRETMLMPSRHL